MLLNSPLRYDTLSLFFHFCIKFVQFFSLVVHSLVYIWVIPQQLIYYAVSLQAQL